MGTGWRRAFCTTIPREGESPIPDTHRQSSQLASPSPSPRSCANLGFLSGGTNPSTQGLRCRTGPHPLSASDNFISPKFHCKTTNTISRSTQKSPKHLRASNPSSPRSPFSILKSSIRLSSRSSCGLCLQSAKTGQGMAIYTAECSHTFHFPCIAAHVKKNNSLVCPVCNVPWKDLPLLVPSSDAPQTNKPKQDQIKPPQVSNSITKQQQVKVYDDDEPLLSPKFVPIPEVEDEDSGEVGEFQGFFAGEDSAVAIDGRRLTEVEVSLMPEAAVVSAGRTHRVCTVAFRVKAPPAAEANGSSSAHFLDHSRRAPIDLVTVLDVSGSMSGEKLQMLKRAMRLVISSLGPADRLSIVAFSASPKRLLPLRRMRVHGQRAARRIVDRLGCGQGTSVSEALKKASKVLEDRRERNPVASIMLLSDGQDERANGSQRRESSYVSSSRFAHIEIPVHSSGFGDKAGLGYNEPVEDAFAKCVGGLLSVVVQDLRIELTSNLAEISAVYSCNGRPRWLGSGTIRLGDLYAEEERELLVELRVPANLDGSQHVLSVRCSCKEPATQEIINGEQKPFPLPQQQAVRSSTPKIERLRNQFITTRAIAESRRLIEQNELSGAYQMLASARALVKQLSVVSSDDWVKELEAELVELRRRCEVQMEQRRRRELAVVADENGEPLTPTSAWRAAERLAKVAMMRKSLNRIGDLHGFENARF